MIAADWSREIAFAGDGPTYLPDLSTARKCRLRHGHNGTGARAFTYDWLYPLPGYTVVVHVRVVIDVCDIRNVGDSGV